MIPNNVFASENNFMISETIDLNNIEVGDSIVVYENQNTGEKLVVDVLPAITRGVGTGDWSGGNIPYETVVLYPHKETSKLYYSKIGFYVTYSGYSIIDTYGETILCNSGQISDVYSRVITSTPTAYVPAKAQMNWINTQTESVYKAYTCYLRMEINSYNQMRLVWQINPY